MASFDNHYHDISPTGSFSSTERRQRLLPWLLEKLDDENCQGCTWIDKRNGIFKLSWKHVGRPGFDEEKDGELFLDWNKARQTRYAKSKDPSKDDIPSCKGRLRNALARSSMIEQITQPNHIEGKEPFRVYKFVAREPTKESNNDTKALEENEKVAVIEEFLQILEEDGIANRENPWQSDTKFDDIQQIEDMDHEMQDLQDVLFKELDESNQSSELYSTLSSSLPHVVESALTMKKEASLLADMAIELFIQDTKVCYEIAKDKVEAVRIAYQQPQQLTSQILQETERQLIEKLLGPISAHPICFPHSTDNFTSYLLNHVNEGLVIETDASDNVYATRLCRGRIFYAYASDGSSEPQLLQRRRKTMIFNYQDIFLPTLAMYDRGQSKPPFCEVYFSFAQKWEASMPLQDLVLRCKLTHVMASKMLRNVRQQKPKVAAISIEDSLDMLNNNLQQICALLS